MSVDSLTTNRTISHCLSAVLDHGSYTTDGIAGHITRSRDAAGQHAHGRVLNVVRNKARHIWLFFLWKAIKSWYKN